MDVFQLMQTAAFALAFFMAGYTIGQKKKPGIISAGFYYTFPLFSLDHLYICISLTFFPAKAIPSLMISLMPRERISTS